MRTAATLSLIAVLVAAGAVLARDEPTHLTPRPGDVVFTGTITADGGAALQGAQVTVRGTRHGAVSDASGGYSFVAPRAALAAEVELEVALIGYAAQSRRLAAAADTVRADFTLAQVPVALNELVAGSGQKVDRRQEIAAAILAPESALRDAAASLILAPQRGMQDSGAASSPLNSIASIAASPPPVKTGRADPGYDREGYDPIAENPFLAVDANPVSTFSIDVDRASYGNVRRFIENGQLPPADAVRIEELVNYFPYADPAPRGEHPFAVTTQLGAAPWRAGHRLLRIGLRAASIDTRDMPPANLVFLMDVSGSMHSPDKLPLLKQAFGLLVDQLRPADRVAIVVYAGAAGLVLPSTGGDRKDEIMAAIDGLEAGGSTAGGAGLRLAYDIALAHHIEGGNNRVILATDGDFNVGESSDGAMVRLIEEKRAQGTFLTVLGFGTGNLQDAKMEKIADHGNGNYAYIDGLMEARKVLVTELGGTLLTVAKDVKLQVEFNPARVRAYRLIGYENRLLAREDFDDDAKDAGEMGAGHTVTALYEIVPVGVDTDAPIRGVDTLRYATPGSQSPASQGGELAYVKLRYKRPDGATSTRFDHPVPDRATATSADFDFAAAVAAFGLVLRDSEHRGAATFDLALALAKDALGEDRGGYRADFIELVGKAKAIERTVASNTGGGAIR
jgi:Ca-activated chloride channel family protein